MSNYFTAASCLCLMLLSGWVAKDEFTAIAHQRNLAQMPVPSAPKSALSLPWTSKSARGLLGACEVALRPDWATLAPRLAQQANASTCATLASRVDNHWPGDAFAKLVGASANIQMGRLKEAAELLGQSQAAAPNEGWIAERRLTILTHAIEGDSSAAFPALLAHEIGVLLQTQSGAELLASYYLFRPKLRDSLTLALNRAKADHQERFLNQLRLRGFS